MSENDWKHLAGLEETIQTANKELIKERLRIEKNLDDLYQQHPEVRAYHKLLQDLSAMQDGIEFNNLTLSILPKRK